MMIDSRKYNGTGKFAGEGSRGSFGQGELRSNTTYKHSNQSVPTKFNADLRRSSSRRINSIYNRYGLAPDNGLK